MTLGEVIEDVVARQRAGECVFIGFSPRADGPASVVHGRELPGGYVLPQAWKPAFCEALEFRLTQLRLITYGCRIGLHGTS